MNNTILKGLEAQGVQLFEGPTISAELRGALGGRNDHP
jgi:hypothetical protein